MCAAMEQGQNILEYHNSLDNNHNVYKLRPVPGLIKLERKTKRKVAINKDLNHNCEEAYLRSKSDLSKNSSNFGKDLIHNDEEICLQSQSVLRKNGSSIKKVPTPVKEHSLPEAVTTHTIQPPHSPQLPHLPQDTKELDDTQSRTSDKDETEQDNAKSDEENTSPLQIVDEEIDVQNDDDDDQANGSRASSLMMSIDEMAMKNCHHQCLICNLNFATREQLERHESQHPSATVSCKTCNKTFANVYRLQRHMISHEESASLRKFKCTECDKAFKFKHHLKEHVRIHSGEKPFGCPSCGKRFSHSGSYSSHMTSKKCLSIGTSHNSKQQLQQNVANNTQASKSNAGQAPPGLLPVRSLLNALNSSPSSQLHLNNNNNLTADANQLKSLDYTSGFSRSMIASGDAGGAQPDAFLAFLAASSRVLHPFYSLAGPHHQYGELLRQLQMHQHQQQQQNDQLFAAGTYSNNVPTKADKIELGSDPEDMIEEVNADDYEDYEGEAKPATPERQVSSPVEEENSGGLGGLNSILENVNASVTKQLLAVNMHRLASPTPQQEQKQSLEFRKHEGLAAQMAETLALRNEYNKYHPYPDASTFRSYLTDVDGLDNGFIKRRDSSSDADDGASNSSPSSHGERKVRVRTAISDEQQAALKRHYAMNPRPGRDESRKVAEILGLDPRVVQVWFQNNRARERRLFMHHNHASDKPQHQQYPTPEPLNINEEPLDLSVKQKASDLNYGIKREIDIPLSVDTDGEESSVINLSLNKKFKSNNDYNNGVMRMYGVHSNCSSDCSPIGTDILTRTPSPRLLTMTYPLINPTFAVTNNFGHKSGYVKKLSPIKANDNPKGRSWSKIVKEEEGLVIVDKRTNVQTNGHLPQVKEEDGQFVCDQCDKAFSKQSSLARHKYEHSGQRPYKCVECPKAFKHKHHLTEHKRLHSGEKPFQCCKCLKRFSHSGSYSQHMNHRYSYCKPYRE